MLCSFADAEENYRLQTKITAEIKSKKHFMTNVDVLGQFLNKITLVTIYI